LRTAPDNGGAARVSYFYFSAAAADWVAVC
jgi:hypothetical protein